MMLGVGILHFFRLFCLVADRAGVLESGGDTEFWQDINLEQEPD